MIRLLIATGLVALFIWNPYPFQYLELKGYDTLIMSAEAVQNDNILLIDIDEEVIEAYGGYPLPRTFYSDFIKRTNVAGITVLMPDPDIRDRNNDFELASTMAIKPTVLASAASTQSQDLSLHVGTAELGEDPRPWLYQYPGILRTESIVALNAKGLGVVTATPEIDGVTRRIPLVVNVQSKLYPAFALEVLRVGLDHPSYQLKTTPEGIDWIRVPGYPLMKTDGNGRIFLDWNTKFYKQTVSEFMASPIDAPFAIIGVTAEGVVNPTPTPAGLKYPHEVQANILHNLINGSAPSTPIWAPAGELLGLTLGLLLVALTVSSIYISAPVIFSLIGGLLASRLCFKHTDIDSCILCSLISGPTNIKRATISAIILQLLLCLVHI